VQIATVAWHQERGDLARAFRKELIPAPPAFEDHKHRAGLVALADQVRPGGKRTLVVTGLRQRLYIAQRELRVLTELVNEGI
jgi:hypothetical protein